MLCFGTGILLQEDLVELVKDKIQVIKLNYLFLLLANKKVDLCNF